VVEADKGEHSDEEYREAMKDLTDELSHETTMHIISEFLSGKSIKAITIQVQVALWQHITEDDIEATIRKELNTRKR
jgi:hypothetical protein